MKARSNFIAYRELLYALKGTRERKPFVVRISAPFLLKQSAANVRFDAGAAGCTIEFDGLGESSIDVHGIDLIHALALALDVDRHLKGFEKKYDFFWSTGEAYFDS